MGENTPHNHSRLSHQMPTVFLTTDVHLSIQSPSVPAYPSALHGMLDTSRLSEELIIPVDGKPRLVWRGKDFFFFFNGPAGSVGSAVLCVSLRRGDTADNVVYRGMSDSAFAHWPVKHSDICICKHSLACSLLGFMPQTRKGIEVNIIF